MFQSYQSKQINPDQSRRIHDSNMEEMFQSYQSKQINPDVADTVLGKLASPLFQSYQSKQINPDSYPRGASRGAALRCRMAEPIFERLK